MEDMVTFLVGFGFEPAYVLTLDFMSFNALYSSAMRATYISKSEDAQSLAAVVATFMGGAKKGEKDPMTRQLDTWETIIDQRPKAIGAKDQPEKKKTKRGAAEFLADVAKGMFRGVKG